MDTKKNSVGTSIGNRYVLGAEERRGREAIRVNLHDSNGSTKNGYINGGNGASLGHIDGEQGGHVSWPLANLSNQPGKRVSCGS